MLGSWWNSNEAVSLTRGKHAIEVLDGAEVYKKCTSDLRKVSHLLWGCGHNGRRSKGDGCIGRLSCDDVVRDLATVTMRDGMNAC